MALERTGQARSDILIPNIEVYPRRELVVAHSLRAIQAAAISAANDIFILVGPNREPKALPKEVKFEREEIIDNNATDAFVGELKKCPYKNICPNAEGKKEKQAGKSGKDLKLAIGTFGEGPSMVTVVSDVVENTNAATHNWEDAWSIMAVVPLGGVMSLPEEDGETDNYLQKLFAPAAFKSVISIDRPTIENLERIAKHAQIPKSAIRVAVMDRDANKTIIESAHIFGAKVEIIPRGDFIWCIEAIKSDPEEPIIVLGRGGGEEGSIAAVGSGAREATCQFRRVSEEDKEKDLELENHGRIWSLEEFVPAKPEYCMVFAAAITKNTHFPKLEAVRRNPYRNTVDTLVIDKTGFNFRTDEVAA